MKILQEITEWEWPNHIYHINDAGKMVAYDNGTVLVTFKVPKSFSKTGRKFKTLQVIK